MLKKEINSCLWAILTKSIKTNKNTITNIAIKNNEMIKMAVEAVKVLFYGGSNVKKSHS